MIVPFNLPQVLDENADLLEGQVIPIQPFLRTKAKYTDEKALKLKLNAMGGTMNLIPNTEAWNRHFKTEGPALTDTPTADGRRLLLDNETPA